MFCSCFAPQLLHQVSVADLVGRIDTHQVVHRLSPNSMIQKYENPSLITPSPLPIHHYLYPFSLHFTSHHFRHKHTFTTPLSIICFPTNGLPYVPCLRTKPSRASPFTVMFSSPSPEPAFFSFSILDSMIFILCRLRL